MTIKKYAGDKITGLSSDTKPTNVPEGATFYELDTGKVYRRYSSSWTEIENTKANNAFTTANLAYAQANAAYAVANSAGGGADTVARVTANEAYIQANTARNHANVAYGQANIALSTANAALPNVSNSVFSGNLTVSEAIYAKNIAVANGFIDLGPGSRPSYLEGRIYYDNVDKSLTVYNNDPNFVLPLGQKEFVKIWNDTGATLEKGKPVYATGFHASSHHHLTVDLADASDPTKFDVIGLVAANIANSDHGYVITRGWLGGIDTSGLTAAERFHLGYSAPGTLVTTSPEYPNYPFDIGYCVVSDATDGFLYIDRQSHTFERLRILQSARVDGDFFVEGDFTVLGTQTIVGVNGLSVGTQFIYIGAGDSISNANTYFTGSGLDDLEFRGHYEGVGTTNYYVKISATNPDKFSWSYLSDFSVLQSENVTIQLQTTQPLANGIGVYFNANTGHTLNDKWNASVTGVSTDFGFVGSHVDGPNGYTHAGLFRDATDGAFKFFRSYDPEVETTVDISNNTFNLANVEVNRITAAQVYEGSVRLSNNIDLSYGQANDAYTQANTGRTHANVSYAQANTARDHANAAFAAANSAGGADTVARTTANAAFIQANTARNQANDAYTRANSTTYTSNVVISVADNSNAALRITQTGTSEAIRVEDETNPDSTPFIVLATGNVGIQVALPNVPLQVSGQAFIYRNNAPTLSVVGAIAEFAHNSNSYTQLHIRNANTGKLASGDLVLTTETGTDTTEYVDLGINNSQFNSGDWTINGAGDAYLYTANGGLAIGVANTSKSIQFFTGGFLAANEDARIDPSGNLLIGRTTSTVGNGVKLDVNGAINASVILVNGADKINAAFTKANTVNVRSTAPLNIYVGTTAPTGNNVGDIWIDTN